MTLIFDSYIASIGPSVAVTESRKNCQLNVDIQYPGGFQYSVLSADYRGYAAIQKGVTGTLKSTYYFSGQTDQVCFCLELRACFNGKIADPFSPPPNTLSPARLPGTT